MNLISCDNCGVVIDLDKNPFPCVSRKYKDDGEVDETMFLYRINKYVPFIDCIVCDDKVFPE